MNNDVFCKKIGITDEFSKRVCSIVRRCLANRFRMGIEQLLPDIELNKIVKKSLLPFSFYEIQDEIQGEIAYITKKKFILTEEDIINIPPFQNERFFCFYQRKAPETVGDWIYIVSSYLVLRTQELQVDKGRKRGHY